MAKPGQSYAAARACRAEVLWYHARRYPYLRASTHPLRGICRQFSETDVKSTQAYVVTEIHTGCARLAL